jgi:hypothetical protein
LGVTTTGIIRLRGWRRGEQRRSNYPSELVTKYLKTRHLFLCGQAAILYLELLKLILKLKRSWGGK